MYGTNPLGSQAVGDLNLGQKVLDDTQAAMEKLQQKKKQQPAAGVGMSPSVQALYGMQGLA